MELYLDNCCFNRPYDDQSSIKIRLETQAKLYIQQLIKEGVLKLTSSFILALENSQNPNLERKIAINKFISHYSSNYVSAQNADKIKQLSQVIMKSGVKWKDATHIACAIYAKCEYFITTDKRLLNYQTNELSILNPLHFIELIEEN